MRLYATDTEIREPYIVDEAGLAALKWQQVGREPIGTDGSFKVNIDARQSQYQGGRLVAVIEVPFLAPMDGPERNHPTQYLVLETIRPEWKESDKAAAHYLWNATVNSDIWCKLMALFDVWCICGRVVDCKTQRPVSGATVKGMDDDWIKDDFLGSSVTDTDGYFRICFRSITFKNTFLSPLINVETPFGGTLGPDVYFTVELGGSKLLEENPSVGKSKERKNSGHCSCFTLCVDFGGDDEKDPIRALWLSVGGFAIPDAVSMHDFDANGYGGGLKYAFYRTLPLRGEVKPKSLAGNPMEYRFMASYDTLNNAIGGPYVPAASFSPITLGNGQLHVGQVGVMVRPFPTSSFPVVITAAEVDADGWINVQKAIERIFATDPYGIGITPADINQWYFEDSSFMAGLDTSKFTVTHSAPAGIQAGDAMAAGAWPTEMISIRFENREVVAPGVYNPSIGNGQTLNRIVISNDNPVALLAAKDNNGNVNFCGEFTSPPNLHFTIYHPHLSSASLSIYKNDGTWNSPLNLLPAAPHSIANGGTRPGTVTANGIAPTSPLPGTCIYIANLSYDLRLTTGDGGQPWGPAQTIFYYKQP
ncbi:MAG: hypothetical protein U0176_20715 [Bacteroidia bacterium]